MNKSSRTISGIIANFIATGFYSGRFPLMPGTAGTLVAVLLTYGLHQLVPREHWPVLEYSLIVVFSLIGALCTHIVLKKGIYGAQAKDPQSVVVDEFAGYYAGVAGLGGDVRMLLLGFIVFRVFDILKPPPLNIFERLPGALGVMADDLGAGVYTALVMHTLWWILMF